MSRTRARTGCCGRAWGSVTSNLHAACCPSTKVNRLNVNGGFAVCQHPITSDLTAHVSPLPKEDLYHSERAFTAGLTVKV